MADDRIFFQSLIISLLHFALETGLTVREISADLPSDFSSVNISGLRLRAQEYLSLVGKLQEMTGIPRLGLHVGAQSRCAYLGIVGYVMMNCRNYGEAIQKYVEYQKIGNSVLTIELEQTRETARCLWLSVHEQLLPIRQFVIEGSIMATVKEFAEITGKQMPLQQVGFDWARPDDAAEYEKFFDARVVFNQPVTYISMDRRHLDTPIRQPNSELLELFENHARKTYLQIRQNSPVSDEVMRRLSRTIVNTPGLNVIASQMGLSGKNLQLKLKKEGNTFVDIRNKVRCAFAKRMLENENYNAAEIGYLLGFSEPSAFYRTFKRWTGLTPVQYRVDYRSNLVSGR